MERDDITPERDLAVALRRLNAAAVVPPADPSHEAALMEAFDAAHGPAPALSERSEWKGPALSERSESKGPALSERSEWKGPALSERSEWKGPALSERSEWKGPALSERSEWKGPALSERSEWKGPALSERSEWKGPALSERSEWKGPALSERSEWKGPALSERSESKGRRDYWHLAAFAAAAAALIAIGVTPALTGRHGLPSGAASAAQTPQAAARDARLEPPSEFVMVPGASGLPPMESGTLVRMDVPVAMLASYGVTPPPGRGATVTADLVVAQDGLPRAVRLVVP